MSEIILLDYRDVTVHIYNYVGGGGNYVGGGGEIEDFLFTQEGFNKNETEWMSAPKLTFQHHGESIGDVVFRIEEDEIRAFTDKDISLVEMKTILSYIENDEGVWEAIEVAKRDAITFTLRG